MASLFVYGSLMAAQVQLHIIGRIPITMPAFLVNYHRFKVANAVYPAISYVEGSKVGGILLNDITEEEFRMLDKFEMGYSRAVVSVNLEKSTNSLNAFTYIWDSDPSELYGTWEFEEFKPHIQSFLQMEGEL